MSTSKKMISSAKCRVWLGSGLYVAVIALALLYAFAERQNSHRVSAAMEEASRRFSIYLIAEGIHAYRDSTSTLPATLEEIGLDEAGIAYKTNGATYRLITLDGTYSTVFVEGDNTDQLKKAYAVLEESAVR